MAELDVVERIYTFYHMSEWFMEDPSRLRAKLKDEEDCIDWRVIPLGYDSKHRTYWLFDDNRLYRESLPSETMHPNGKQKFNKATPRKGKRTPRMNASTSQDIIFNTRGDTPEAWLAEDSSRLGKWEVLYVTLQDWNSAGELFKRPRNADERFLQQRLQDDIMPQVLAELRAKKKKQEVEDAIQHRKRSTRLQLKQAQKQEQEHREAHEISKSPSPTVPLIEQEVAQRKEKLVTQRMSREQRLLERQNRLLGSPSAGEAPTNGTSAGTPTHSDHKGLVQVTSADQVVGKSEETRDRKRKYDGLDSPRQQKTTSATKASKQRGRKPSGKKRGRPPKYPRPLNVSDDNEEEEEEEGDWVFKCVCGVAGQNVNDGKPMVACESCQVWQHIHCTDKMDRQLGRPPRNWDTEEFICERCQNLPRPSLPSPRPSVQLGDGLQQVDREPEPTLPNTTTSFLTDHPQTLPVTLGTSVNMAYLSDTPREEISRIGPLASKPAKVTSVDDVLPPSTLPAELGTPLATPSPSTGAVTGHPSLADPLANSSGITPLQDTLWGSKESHPPTTNDTHHHDVHGTPDSLNNEPLV
ncbi:hypothetical protein IWQ62_005686 [Dispira parvispora]|uniref:Zinc finger PHD-type domain-containing protein n=1 Tax=Dispira parvispora TaxID=1520584 RepID=A0A9W8E4A6_9FUNG|nr:hypothetical protein IWQ62_005686 [Dispira parvispora]